MKILIFLILLMIGIVSSILIYLYTEKDLVTSIILGLAAVCATVALGLVTSFIYEAINSWDDNNIPQIDEDDGESDIDPIKSTDEYETTNEPSDNARLDDEPSSNEKNDDEYSDNSKDTQELLSSPNDIEDVPDKNSIDASNNNDNQEDAVTNPIKDITGLSSVSNKIEYKNQIIKYYYTAPITGTYCFESILDPKETVRVRISGENEKSIDSNLNALTINLEEGKKYILSIEYNADVCDYTVNIYVPDPIKDITGLSSVSNKIEYKNQKIKYYYTAPITGTYRFESILGPKEAVRVRISGENKKSIHSNLNALTIDLEEGKKYILSIEYNTDICDYTVNINVP